MALARINPHLKTCVLDFKTVCDAARKIIRRERMSRRVKTIVGDMNRDLPRGFDVMLFWNIGHIDTKVMKMAYKSLPEGGMVVRSCPPVSKAEIEPPTTFIHGYLSVRPKGQEKPLIINSLKQAGFSSVKYRLLAQGLGLITGHKN